MSNDKNILEINENKKKIYFKTEQIQSAKEIKFRIKKLKRSKILEPSEQILQMENILKRNSKINQGRWTRSEHQIFLNSCLYYGPIWDKTRTKAQIRSHAQKYVIKLCKKYNIEIKSRRKIKFISEHLNFPYKKKTPTVPFEMMTENDYKFIKSFNFYEKKIDFSKLDQHRRINKKNVFLIIKNENPTICNDNSKDSTTPYNSCQIIHVCEKKEFETCNESKFQDNEQPINYNLNCSSASSVDLNDSTTRQLLNFFVENININNQVLQILESNYNFTNYNFSNSMSTNNYMLNYLQNSFKFN